MIFEALAAFNQWYIDVFIMNAGYWFLIAVGIVIISTIHRVRKHKKQVKAMTAALQKFSDKNDKLFRERMK